MWLSAALAVLMLTLSCGTGSNVRRNASPAPVPIHLPPIGYTIQVGAFAHLGNAVRFTERLQTRGLDAYHFRDSEGLYKVRFGNYATMNSARFNAERLKAEGIIHSYYLVGPKEYAGDDRQLNGNDDLRAEIVNTAKHYIGVNYRWGGQSSVTGFDCSGLAMVVYRLNGLKLPRSSRQQWKTGKPVEFNRLSKGDLVFFATTGSRRVSHVGIYIGDNKFLHAPGRGREICITSLANGYYRSRYLGARSYL